MLSTGRQDFGIIRSSLEALEVTAGFDVRLWLGGMHFSERHGETWRSVEMEGFRIARRLDLLGAHESPVEAAALAVQSIGTALDEEQPWALMLVGDRTETLAAGLAATLARVPIVHLHGGEESEGAIDNACRHALTKLSHLHLVSHPVHAARVIQMGERPESVHVVGAPGLDNRFRSDLPTLSALEVRLGTTLRQPICIVTVHPATLNAGDPREESIAVAAALESWPGSIVVTQANNDAGGAQIREYWHAWGERHPEHAVVDSLGEAGYWGLMQSAAVVLGNSSSGIIEAPFAGVASINVGDRQKGRLRFGRTIDVRAERALIAAALEDARTSTHPAGSIAGVPAGPAAPRIVAALESWQPEQPPRKSFFDQPCGEE